MVSTSSEEVKDFDTYLTSNKICGCYGEYGRHMRMFVVRFCPDTSDVIKRINLSATRLIVPKKREGNVEIGNHRCCKYFSLHLKYPLIPFLNMYMLVDDFMFVAISIRPWLCYARRSFVVDTSSDTTLRM